MIKNWMREPLIHFLAIGTLLFVVFAWRGSGTGSGRIVITPGQVDAMVAGFTRTWQRPPTEQEVKGLIDEYVRDEIATREAQTLGLDRDDTIIRRRLRQKLEFLAEDSAAAAPPTDAELRSWLDAHPETYRVEPEVAFRQVFLDPERHGAALDTDARALLARLAAAGSSVDGQTLGDSQMLPIDVPRSTRSDVARRFGVEFADAVVKLDRGRWSGPIRSGYGLHLVFVRERLEGRLPTLAEVRPEVGRDVLADRRTREKDAMYERLLARYRVIVEPRPAASPPAAKTTGAAR